MPRFMLLLSLACLTGAVSACVKTEGHPVAMTQVQSNFSLSGKVTFPDSRFKTRATVNALTASTTVSLLYPPQDENHPNVTVATGLSNASGEYVLLPDASFTPTVNAVFVLEALKRLGGVGERVMTLRTFVRWTGTAWESITTPDLDINVKTTALTLISEYENLSPDSTLATIQTGTGNSVLADIGTISAAHIQQVADRVTQAVQENRDPIGSLRFLAGQYALDRKVDIGQMIQTQACVACNLQGVDLSGVSLEGMNLSQADLTGQDLSAVDLSGTNLNQANLSYANLSGLNLTTTSLTGANLSDAFLEQCDLSGNDLSGSNLNYAYLSGANLNNAVTDGTTVWSDADLSGATWTTGQVCASGSYGTCN